MRIEITYKVQTAYGHEKTNRAIARTLKEAEELCNAIEGPGCRVIDVTRED